MYKKLIAVLVLFPLFAFAESVTIEGYNPDGASSQTPSPQQNIMPQQQPGAPAGSQQPSMPNQYNMQMPSNNQAPPQSVQPNSQPPQQNVQPNYQQVPQQNTQPLQQSMQPAPAQAAVSAPSTQQAVSIETVVQAAPQVASQPVSPQETAKWQEFFNSLAACTTGVYDLRQLDASLAVVYGDTATNTINSKQGDLCSVTVSLAKPPGAGVPATNTKRLGGYECLLSKTTVNQMISYYSGILKSGSSKSVIDPALNSSMNKECKLFVWVNGQKSFAVEK